MSGFNKIGVLMLFIVTGIWSAVSYHAQISGSDMHRPFRWVFADSATRVGTSVTYVDTMKYAYQNSDSSVWVLKDDSPVLWLKVNRQRQYADSMGFRTATIAGTARWDTGYSRTVRTSGAINIGAGSAANAAALDVSYGGLSVLIGANSNSYSRSDATTKSGRIVSAPYLTAEEPVSMIMPVNELARSYLEIGGGASVANAVTLIRFFTATNTTTTSGTVRAVIDSAGNIGVGTQTPTVPVTIKGNFSDTGNAFITGTLSVGSTASVDSLKSAKGVFATIGRFSSILFGDSTVLVKGISATIGRFSSIVLGDTIAAAKGVSGTHGRFSGTVFGDSGSFRTLRTSGKLIAADSIKSSSSIYAAGNMRALGSVTASDDLYSTDSTTVGTDLVVVDDVKADSIYGRVVKQLYDTFFAAPCTMYVGSSTIDYDSIYVHRKGRMVTINVGYFNGVGSAGSSMELRIRSGMLTTTALLPKYENPSDVHFTTQYETSGAHSLAFLWAKDNNLSGFYVRDVTGAIIDPGEGNTTLWPTSFTYTTRY